MRTRALLAIAALVAAATAGPVAADVGAAPEANLPSVHSLGVCALPAKSLPRGLFASSCAAWRAPASRVPALPAAATTLPVCVTYAGINDRCEKWRSQSANQPSESETGLPPVTGEAVDPANGLTVIATNSSPGGVATMGAAAFDTRSGAAKWTTSVGGLVPAGVPTATTAIAMTPNGGTVFIAGYMQESVTVNQAPYSFYFVVALNATTGRVLWANRYLGMVGGQLNKPTAAVATASEVIITGFSVQPGPFQVPPLHYGTAAFSARNGRLLWVSRYHGVNGTNIPTAIAASSRGDRVYVTGASQYYNPAPISVFQYATVAYSTRNGAQLWVSTRRSPVAASTSFATAIASSGSSVYISGAWQYAGTTAQPQYEYGTVGYASTGRVLWSANHLATGNGFDVPTDVVVAGSRVVVTGSTSGTTRSVNLAAATVSVAFPSAETVAYDTSGRLKWSNLYQPQGGYATLGTVLATGPHATTVYVGGGIGPTTFTTYPFTMAIAVSSGQTQWVARDDMRDPSSFSTTLLGVPNEAPVGIGVDAKAGIVIDATPANPTLGTSPAANGALLLGYAL